MPTTASPPFIGHGFASFSGTVRGSADTAPPAMPTHAVPGGGAAALPVPRVSSVPPSGFCPDAIVTALNTFG